MNNCYICDQPKADITVAELDGKIIYVCKECVKHGP